MDVKEGLAPQEQQKVLDFYTKFGPTTDPGSKRNLEVLKKLPAHGDRFEFLPDLVKGWQFHPVLIEHPEILKYPRLIKIAADLKAEYEREGKKFESEDKELNTVAKIMNEVLRRNSNYDLGEGRFYRDRVRFSCAGAAYILAAIEKAHGIPARVRAGFADYFPEHNGGYIDHWVTEIWDKNQKRWKIADLDGAYDLADTPYKWDDVPSRRFVTGSEAWLNARRGTPVAETYNHTLDGVDGFRAILWQMSFDVGNIVGVEPTYWYKPKAFQGDNFDSFMQNEEYLAKYDQMARLMQDPDKNFDAIQTLYKENEIFHPVKYED